MQADRQQSKPTWSEFQTDRSYRTQRDTRDPSDTGQNSSGMCGSTDRTAVFCQQSLRG